MKKNVFSFLVLGAPSIFCSLLGLSPSDYYRPTSVARVGEEKKNRHPKEENTDIQTKKTQTKKDDKKNTQKAKKKRPTACFFLKGGGEACHASLVLTLG